MGSNLLLAPDRSPLKEKRTAVQRVSGALRRPFSGGALTVAPVKSLLRSGSDNVRAMLVRPGDPIREMQTHMQFTMLLLLMFAETQCRVW